MSKERKIKVTKCVTYQTHPRHVSPVLHITSNVNTVEYFLGSIFSMCVSGNISERVTGPEVEGRGVRGQLQFPQTTADRRRSRDRWQLVREEEQLPGLPACRPFYL